MKDTLELFSVRVGQLDTLALFTGQNISDFSENQELKKSKSDTKDSVLIFCDLAFGASASVVTKLLINIDYREKIQVITGMNLPIVLVYSQLRLKS